MSAVYIESNMSGLMSGLRKFFTKDRIIVFVIFIVIAIFLLYYSTGKNTITDGMDVGTESPPATAVPTEPPLSNGVIPSATASSCGASGYSSKEVVNPSELLPKDDNSQWSSLNPSSQNVPNIPDVLQAGYHTGVDTVGQTLKNANQQLRSDPIITKVDIGPWNQSTVEPDLMRVPLEVGSTCAS